MTVSQYLSQPISILPKIGPKLAETYAKQLEISTIEDLLNYYPTKHIDRSQFFSINQISSSEAYIQIRARIRSIRKEGDMRKQRLVATAADSTGQIELVFFKGIQYLEQSIKVDNEYIIFGKPSAFNGRFNFVHPEMETPERYAQTHRSPLQAIYSIPEKLRNNQFITARSLSRLIGDALSQLPAEIPETLAQSIVAAENLCSRHQAIITMHQPQSHAALKKALERLKYEELFWIQLRMAFLKIKRKTAIKGFALETVGEHFNSFYNQHLPFPLTNAQKRVVKEIRNDMRYGKQMNRLLQGDVGSGKTLVGLMVMLLAIDNGFQACLMAPTEILATQHFKTISNMLKDMPISVELLTGSTKAKERRTLHEALSNGRIQILVGTHALIEDCVQFKNLGLVIIDEQHRFGVAQRAKLWNKNSIPPHVLVMTATPIPRTLAMTVYGDLDVSIIDELPPGRKPVKTLHFFDNRRYDLYQFIKKQIAEGRQIYFVFPLIEESEKLDYKSLEEGFIHLKDYFPEHEGYKMLMLHGKMTPAEKESTMQLFKNNQAQILVATTVIEVGVDVPNASVMVIENSEKFGLSQLHQLRGRVGRGASQSYCVLMSSVKLSKDARSRLSTMVESTDGFVIAEADLKLRGPGDITGTQQSGIPLELNLASLVSDAPLLSRAKATAESFLAEDPTLALPQNQIMKAKLLRPNNAHVSWDLVS